MRADNNRLQCVPLATLVIVTASWHEGFFLTLIMWQKRFLVHEWRLQVRSTPLTLIRIYIVISQFRSILNTLKWRISIKSLVDLLHWLRFSSGAEDHLSGGEKNSLQAPRVLQEEVEDDTAEVDSSCALKVPIKWLNITFGCFLPWFEVSSKAD